MADVEVLGNGLIEISIEPPPPIEIEVLPGGISYGGVLSLEYQLVLGRLISQPSLHKTLSYSDGNLVAINVYNDSSLTTQLLEITFSYTGSNLTQKVLTDVIANKTLTVTYGYTDGNLTSISETFS